MNLRTMIVEVCQGVRAPVRKALTEAGISIEAGGYTDSSSTMWGFWIVVPARWTPDKVQDAVWGYDGLGAISCSVREAPDGP